VNRSRWLKDLGVSKEAAGVRDLQVIVRISIMAALAILLAAGCGSDERATNNTNADRSQGSSGAHTGGQSGQGGLHSSGEVCFERGESFEGEARLYIEHNATDQDTGVHGTFDQEGLTEACLQKPDGTPIMLVDPNNQLDKLGINQFFFESREPPAHKYSIAELKADFPEGRYRISGIDFEGKRRVGTALFTHDIPAPPEIVSPEVVPEENAEHNTVSPSGLSVRWRPVRQTLDGRPVDITGYEVIVTRVNFNDPHGLSRPEYDVHVPPEVTELAVPEGFVQPGTLYELEVLALEESGNQTITVGFFTTR
jgi:hypothetical protein